MGVDEGLDGGVVGGDGEGGDGEAGGPEVRALVRLVGEPKHGAARSHDVAVGGEGVERGRLDPLAVERDHVDALGQATQGVRVVGRAEQHLCAGAGGGLPVGLGQHDELERQRDRRLGHHLRQLARSDDADPWCHAGESRRTVHGR
ncbi:MAG: hypothetical protein R2699_16860 [Acidimicrobiales bacterium]